jgi:hypothetical protein
VTQPSLGAGRETTWSPAPRHDSSPALATLRRVHRLRTRQRQRFRVRVGVRAAGVAATGMVLLTGCAGSDQADPVQEATGGVALRLVIPDATMREPEVPCSGARAFRFAHPQAPYIIEDPDGQAVATGALPEGRAEKAFNVDLGDGRQPTVCVMSLEVAGVDSLDGHSLVIGDRTPLPISRNRSLGDIPEVVLQ